MSPGPETPCTGSRQLPGGILERHDHFFRQDVHHPLPGTGSRTRDHKEGSRTEKTNHAETILRGFPSPSCAPSWAGRAWVDEKLVLTGRTLLPGFVDEMGGWGRSRLQPASPQGFGLGAVPSRHRPQPPGATKRTWGDPSFSLCQFQVFISPVSPWVDEKLVLTGRTLLPGFVDEMGGWGRSRLQPASPQGFGLGAVPSRHRPQPPGATKRTWGDPSFSLCQFQVFISPV